MDKKQHKKFDWNKVDWSKYPNGIMVFNNPISNIGCISPGTVVRMPDKKEKITVSYWNGKRWIKNIDSTKALKIT